MDADAFECLSHSSCKVNQSSGIKKFLRYNDRPVSFFKAKKLKLSGRKQEHFMRQLIRSEDSSTLSHWNGINLFNRLEANELNLATCLDYFDWVDSSLDDLENLCWN